MYLCAFVLWSTLGALAATPPADSPLSWKPNADLAGDAPSAWFGAAARTTAAGAVPTLMAPDTGLDAFVFRGPSHPKAPRKLELTSDGGQDGTSLLVGYHSGVPAGSPVLRVVRTLADGTVDNIDLKAGDDIFALDASGSSDTVVAVPLGNGQALSLIHVATATKVTLEVRADADVALFGAASGSVGALPLPKILSFNGFPFPMDIRSPGSPVPPAWTIEPRAGAHGRLTLKDGHFAWPDGTRARFWGVNLLNAACYPSHEVADALAIQLPANGINLVRLHHFDTPMAGGVNPSRKSPSDPLFTPDGLDRFDYLVAKLEAAGVYVELETATGRTFTTADGVNDPSPEIPSGHKVLPMFESLWRKAYMDWARTWLGRTNTYTGLRYAEDPGVAMVELANENSLLMVWLTGGVERLPLVHRDALDALWNTYVSDRYPDDAAITAAWTGSINPGLRRGETRGHLSRAPSGQGTFNQYPDARVADLYDFYLGLDISFFDELAGVVRGLGYTQPIVGGITYDNPAFAQVMTRYDVIDTHLEWDASITGALRNESIIGHPRSQNLLDHFRIAEVGKPMMVSELNEGFPNDYAAEAPLLWASLASVQDWDALIWLNYTNGPVNDGPGPVGSFSELRFAATKWAQMATASGLFRSGAVPAAPGLFPVWRSLAAVKTEVVEQKRPTFRALRDVATLLSARYREAYGGEAPLPIPGSASTALGWWPDAERFVIQTPGLEAVLGDHGLRHRAGVGEGSGPTRPTHLEAELDGAAAVSLTCLEGTLEACRSGWLIVAGQMENAGMERIAGGSVIVDSGGKSVLLARPKGRVRFQWSKKPEVIPVDSSGHEGTPVSVASEGSGWWSLNMDTAGSTLWWRIR